jgi:hypothetical protein
LDQLTGPQIAEWEAYNKIDPIGEWRNDFRGAKLESLIINIVQQLYAKKGHSPIVTTPIDFMPDWLGEKEIGPKKQSVEEMKEILLSFARRQNKEVERQGSMATRPPSKFKGR